MSRAQSEKASDLRGKNRQSESPTRRIPYPFTALVGQEELKLALILTVIDPYIGGVMIMGHRGTGKSTAVRALADLLPKVKKVRGCHYGCDPGKPNDYCQDCAARSQLQKDLPVVTGPVPVIELPLGATEDRVCGALDIEQALVTGSVVFEPGLLARANRGFLYIDEVNLLEDHLVDLLLDSAASGRNIVEREGISVDHPAHFVLVGSGNPEEGELRPQLLDRFGLFTQVTTILDIDQRVDIMLKRERFERDPELFNAEMKEAQRQLRNQIKRALRLRPQVQLPREQMQQIAALSVALTVDGHRGELTIARAARALAALSGRKSVTVEDIRQVAVPSLRHRLRKDPLDRVDSGVRVEQALDTILPAKGS